MNTSGNTLLHIWIRGDLVS